MLFLSTRTPSIFNGATTLAVLFALSACVNAYILKLMGEKSSISDVECYGPNMEYKPTLGRCECVDGAYGDPDFFCTKELKDFCTIREPQIMETFAGDRYFYDYPCMQTVAEIHMTRNNVELNVNVFVCSEYDQTSNIVLQGMGIQVANVTVYITKDEMKINGISGDMDMIPDNWKSHFRTLHDGSLSFSLSDLMVLIRPFNGDKSSARISGLQVSYNGDTHDHVHEVYELCSHVHGEFEDAEIHMGFKYSELYALMLSMAGYDQMIPEHKVLAPEKLQQQCESVSEAYHHCIIDYQTMTLNRCGPILTNSVIRLCFTYSGFNVMDIFKLCVKAACELNSYSCERLQRRRVLDCYQDLEWCSEHISVQSSNDNFVNV